MTETGFKGWRVPPLRGWASWDHAGLWWLLLTAALAATVLIALGSAWDGPALIPLLRAGINYTRDGGPGLVVFDVSSPQARQAGVAWLLVGPRPDGTVQDRDARVVLAEVAPTLGRALHVISARRRRLAPLFEGMAPPDAPDKAVPRRPRRLKPAQT